MILELRFHYSEFYMKRICKLKCRTLMAKLEEKYDEIHAVCGELISNVGFCVR